MYAGACESVCTPVCRLCGRCLAILGRSIRITVPAVTVAPTALVGSLIRSSNLPHSLQRGVPTSVRLQPCNTASESRFLARLCNWYTVTGTKNDLVYRFSLYRRMVDTTATPLSVTPASGKNNTDLHTVYVMMVTIPTPHQVTLT